MFDPRQEPVLKINTFKPMRFEWDIMVQASVFVTEHGTLLHMAGYGICAVVDKDRHEIYIIDQPTYFREFTAIREFLYQNGAEVFQDDGNPIPFDELKRIYRERSV